MFLVGAATDHPGCFFPFDIDDDDEKDNYWCMDETVDGIGTVPVPRPERGVPPPPSSSRQGTEHQHHREHTQAAPLLVLAAFT